MASFRTSEETMIVDCPREILMNRCESALNKGGFTNIKYDRSSFYITASYKQFIAGDITVTLLSLPDSKKTQINIRVTSVDNIWAKIEEPNAKIAGAFKAYLDDPSESLLISSGVSPSKAQNPQEQGKCKSCGAVNSTVARFCEYCGSPLA
jgi:hypothetical protein